MTPALRLALLPAVAVAFLLGLWVAAGKITNDFGASMGLTAGWFLLAGAVCAGVAWRWRRLALPVLGGYVLAAGASAGYLALSTFRDTVVVEEVAQVGPASGNVSLASGAFTSGAHHTSGRARVVRLRGGARQLQLLEFETSPGPDVRVYLARPDDVGDHADLGGLKGNKGTQQYGIPGHVDLGRYSAVVIWCRAFSVEFGRAEL
jgi:hypothetical protein